MPADQDAGPHYEEPTHEDERAHEVRRTPPVHQPRQVHIDRIPARPADVIGWLDTPIRRNWRHIVIHHSGGASGNMRIFDRAHKARGWDGVGYHFVIGNGKGQRDGVIEVTARWTRQKHGAHAGVDEYNQHGIGICLVGNFEETYPTQKQLRSLVSLISYLQRRCDISSSHVLGHRHVKSTACPGRNFPYHEVLALLAE